MNTFSIFCLLIVGLYFLKKLACLHVNNGFDRSDSRIDNFILYYEFLFLLLLYFPAKE